MRHYLRIPRLAFMVLSFAVVLTAAMIAGCDSTADPTTPEAQKQSEATREKVRELDEKNSADLKKKNKNAPVLRNIKGGLKAGAEPAQ